MIADFNEEKGRQVTEAINAAGGEAAFVKVDISNSKDVQAMVQFICKIEVFKPISSVFYASKMVTQQTVIEQIVRKNSLCN